MKKLFVSALAMLAVALGFTACSSDDELVKENPAQGQKVTVIASTEEPAQRTALGEYDEDKKEYKVVWSPTDKINIGGMILTLKSDDAGKTTGTFERTGGTEPSEISGGSYTAYYPSTYGGTWPTEQTYVEGNMPIGVPMKAEGISVDGEGNVTPISFKNVGGILRLNLKGVAEVMRITVSASNLEPITLNCKYKDEYEDEYGVVLNPVTATPFHIAVPAGEYNDLQIEITELYEEASLVKTANSAITVERSKITDINLTCQDVKKDETTGHAYVELLGCKWATENVGAVEGDYTNWDDAKNAAENWGNGWTLPTKQQWEDLIEDCSFEWKVNYPFGDKTTNGYIVSDFDNPFKYIFLPAVTEEGKSYITYYWTSDKSDTKPYCFWFEPEYEGLERDYYFGVSTNALLDAKFVRPVLGPVEN